MTRTRLLHYGGAALLIVVATLLRMWLHPILGVRLPLATYAIVSMVIAWFAGLGPALVATVLGFILSAYFFVLPYRTNLHGADILELVLRSAVALTGVFLIAALRRARDKASRTTAEIQAATKRMRTVLEGIQDGFYALDRNWRYVYINENAARMVRRERQSLPGKNVWEEFPELRSTQFYTELHRAASEQAPVHFEEYYSPFNSWYEVDGYPSAEGLSVFVRDITARRRGEEERQHLAAIVESSEDAIVGKTLDGVIVSWNSGAEKLYGYTAAEVIGRPISMLVPPDQQDDMPGLLRKVRQGQSISHYETQRVAKDGRRFHVSLTVSPIREYHGRITGASAVARDITDRKQAEEERARLLAREQEARRDAEHAAARTAQIQAVTAALSAALTPGQVAEIVIHQGIAALGGQAGVVAVLPAAGGELQVMSAVNYPAPVIDAWRRLAVSVWDTPVGAAARTGEPILLESVEALAQTYPHLAGVSRALGAGARAALPLKVHGRIIGAMWLAFKEPRTFTEDDRSFLNALAQQCAQALERARLYESEKAARDAAETASRLKDEFLATLSHELRTPLTAILGWSRMLDSPTIDAETRERAIQTIQRNAKVQASLIEDILDVSRIITGKLRLDVRPLDLHQIIEAAVEVLLPAAEAKGILLQKVLDPKTGVVLGDAQRLQQVIWNLLSNAIKFTPRAGRVVIALRRINSQIEITVSDTGQGINPAFLPHVFDRFRQADSSSTRHHGGLGLGLAIVRHLVELHGGSVQADSPGEGHGSTFAVRLPLLPVSYVSTLDTIESARLLPAADTTASSHGAPQLLEGIRVLVLDDEAETRALLSVVLTGSGAHVVTASSSAEALATLNESLPHLLVADIGMPDEDGYAFIRKWRALESQQGQAHVPAIALTAYARAEDRIQALEAGYQVHLPKPVEPSELVLAVAALLGKTATQRTGRGPELSKEQSS